MSEEENDARSLEETEEWDEGATTTRPKEDFRDELGGARCTQNK